MKGDQQTVAVIGLGKIGLTLAAVFANNGFNVIGADINENVVRTINKGKSHIKNEPGLDQLVQEAFQNNQLSATVNTSNAVSRAEIIIVIVPVLIDEKNNIDYQFIDRAVEDIGKGIKEDSIVIFETTLPPGDTRHRFGKTIEEISGLRIGKEIHLAYSPERVYSNRIIQDLKQYPKVIGAWNERSLELASHFYRQALDCELILVSSLEAAEFSKVAECVYRDVNIALANELALFAEKMGIPMNEVIHASNSQPFSHIHQPGIGVGGHCIPIYPYFFIQKGLDQGLTPSARKINDQMANYSLTKLEQEMEDSLNGKNILILGLSYRENVKEPTKSTTLLLIDQLKEKEANVFVHDPLFQPEEIKTFGVHPLSFEDSIVSNMDAVILQAFHDEYKSIDFQSFPRCKVVLDGRNKLKKETITSHGIKYIGIGG